MKLARRPCVILCVLGMTLLGIAFAGLYSYQPFVISFYSLAVSGTLLIFTIWTLQTKVVRWFFGIVYGLLSLHTIAFALMAISNIAKNRLMFGLLLLGALGLILLSASHFLYRPYPASTKNRREDFQDNKTESGQNE